MDLLVNKLKDFCEKQGFECTYWIGYSGGLDSHVLLHLFATLRQIYPLKLHAVYINHQLSSNAAEWAQHCEQVCKTLQVNFTAHRIDAKSIEEKSPEEIARDRRYGVFSELLAPHDVLLTAHHQDDQAETVLLQMLRGAGPKGLSAMPKIKPFALGWHARPLLDFTRAELRDYAEQNNLEWINDESNTDIHFTRNFLRHEVLPVLKRRWSTVSNTLARVAENCVDAQILLDEIAEQDLSFVMYADSDVPLRKYMSLSVKKLLTLNSARQRNVLRSWLQQFNFPIPPSVKLQQIQQDMLLAREDKSPHFVWEGIELRRYRDELFVMPCLIEHDPTQVYEWNLSRPLLLPQFTLLAQQTQNKGLRADIKKVSIRFRQGGEMIQLPGRTCRHELKKLFQEWGIPPWERERVPLIYVEDKLAAVVGYYLSEEFSAEQGLEISLSHSKF